MEVLQLRLEDVALVLSVTFQSDVGYIRETEKHHVYQRLPPVSVAVHAKREINGWEQDKLPRRRRGKGHAVHCSGLPVNTRRPGLPLRDLEPTDVGFDGFRTVAASGHWKDPRHGRSTPERRRVLR